MKLRIKYFEGATKLQKIAKGNWIDVYAREDVFIKEGTKGMIPLGFALELPKGWEGYLAPRSSTFKTWGLIQTNSFGIVDDTYIGDNDEWNMPVYCLTYKDYNFEENCYGTWVRKGDRVGQFRIQEVMPEIEFDEVEHLGNADRCGFGSSGKNSSDIKDVTVDGFKYKRDPGLTNEFTPMDYDGDDRVRSIDWSTRSSDSDMTVKQWRRLYVNK